MLEPWSMGQKAWKKIPYFHLVEKRLASKARLVRAVGRPELSNLKKHFIHAVHIPNGIYQNELSPASAIDSRSFTENRFLFLARLHHKKNVVTLANAWIKSSLAGKPEFILRIAGTDDGEKAAIEKILIQHPGCGIEFLGPVFGEAKKQLLSNSDFYLLPSLSEGFPTSVVEAAGSGLICLISEGCNFPELLDAGLALSSGMSEQSIQSALEKAVNLDPDKRRHLCTDAGKLIQSEFLWEKIAAKQASEYGLLL
jgi:glycosyltransferase involved in cell wall biosynthesis